LKILLTGKTGQVGHELERRLAGLGELVALDRAAMDLANLDQVRGVIRAVKPDLIVNPAAYTAVDKAESEPQLAMRINCDAPALMAEEAAKLGAAMIHYSTDYVFDGAKNSGYTEDDIPAPLNAYGRSKLAGERAIAAVGIPHLILRTSWVYGNRGSNFLLTILRLAAERDELRIVDDQRGAPTWSRAIADVTGNIVERLGAAASDSGRLDQEAWREHSGLYHFAAQGQTTWYGFANAILARARLAKKPTVTPITTAQYPLPAQRPASSILDSGRLGAKFGPPLDWETGLDLCMADRTQAASP
jgi:dTDP-4-dehydrorhamnose reductase